MLTLFLLAACMVVLVGVLVFGSLERLLTDVDTPSNFLLFPNLQAQPYPEDIVNLYIPKPWEKSQRIPCRIESFSPQDSILILYAHGTDETLAVSGHYARQLSTELQCTVITFEYSGYGSNKLSTFERSQEGMRATLAAVYEYVDLDPQLKHKEKILLGNGLGACVCIDFAASLKPEQVLRALIVIDPFSSLQDLIEDNVQLFTSQKYASKLANRFDNRWNMTFIISNVNVQTLLLHDPSNKFISLLHSTRLKTKKQDLDVEHLPSRATWKQQINAISDWL